MIINQDAIKKLLPHRPPFLLIDKVEISSPGEAGRSTIDFDAQTAFWSYDGISSAEMNSLKPAPKSERDVLLLEAAAQLLGIVLASNRSANNESEDNGNEGQHLLLGFDNVQYHQSKSIQGNVELTVQVKTSFNSMSRCEFIANHGDCTLAIGELTVMQRGNADDD